MNIGIIGGGAIATFLLQTLSEDNDSNLKVRSVYIRDLEKYKNLAEDYDVELFNDLFTFLDSKIDIVVEAANIAAVNELIPQALKKKDVVLISIGALANDTFTNKLNSIAEANDRSILLPSGGIGGLDLLQSANALGEVTTVSLTTRKPAASLIDEVTDKEVVIFEGAASEAIKKFPKNINVSIILSLAGIGTDQTKVTIIADPTIDKNSHTIEMNGSAGKAVITSINNPLETNPKSSYLAALSIISTLKKLTNRIKIGS